MYTRLPYTQLIRLFEDHEIVADDKVVTNLIGILFGGTSGEIYEDLEEPRFAIKPTVGLNDITIRCSQNYLSQWIKYGDTMKSMMELLYPDSDGEVFEELSTSLLGYLHTLRKISHQEILKPLVQETESYMRDARIIRVDSYLKCMTNLSNGKVLSTIDLLYHLHREILESESFEYNYKCTGHVVDVMQRHLSLRDYQMRKVVWVLFINTIRPSMFYLESLLLDGYSPDPNQEFFFDVLGEDDHCVNDSFWDHCLEVRDVASLPAFLASNIEQIVLGIKSRLLCNACAGNSTSATPTKESLFEYFWKQLLSFLAVPKSEEQCSKTNSKPSNFGPLLDLKLTKFKNLTVYDTLYYDSLNQLSPLAELPKLHVDSVPEFPDIDEKYHQLPDQRFTPLNIALEKAFGATFSAYANDASQHLLKLYRPRYLSHLRIFTDYYLLHQSSHTISLYLNTLFEQVASLRRTGSSRFSDFELDDHEHENLFFTFTFEANQTRDPLKVIGCLHLYYEEMEPFSRILLNTNVRQVYDNALHLLVTLKYSKWLLATLFYEKDMRLPQSTKSSSGQHLQHLLFLNRFKMMSVINNLHYYVMQKLNEEIYFVNEANLKATTFEHLKSSIEKNAKAVARYTFQDVTGYNELVLKIYLTVSRICKMWSSESRKSNNNNIDFEREAEMLRKSVVKLEAVSKCFYEPLRD
ncbi:hypothetical protein HDE_14523 [Halotydeus destructor]|nr:hypothetical protein HDE_14523 [Halotydeus destructor]